MKQPFGFASLFLVLFAGHAAAQPSNPPTGMAQKLKVGPEESLAMIVPAKGVQIYECRAGKAGEGGYEWAFVAPEADLFDTARDYFTRVLSARPNEAMATEPTTAELPAIRDDVALGGTEPRTRP